MYNVNIAIHYDIHGSLEPERELVSGIDSLNDRAPN